MSSYSPDHVWVHGRPSTYTHHKCRCVPCKAAAAERQRQYRHGERDKFVPVGPVSDHIRDLITLREGETYCWNLQTLATYLGFVPGSLDRVLHQRQTKTLESRAKKILAVPRYEETIVLPTLVSALAAKNHLNRIAKKKKSGDYWRMSELADALRTTEWKLELITRGLRPLIEKDYAERILALPSRAEVLGIGDHPNVRDHLRWLCSRRPDHWQHCEVAEAVGMSQWHLRMFSTGKRKISKKLAKKILALPCRSVYLEMQKNLLTRKAA